MPNEFKYDVFLSHSADDTEAMHELANQLKGDGLRVGFKEWVVNPSDIVERVIEEGLESSRILVLAMSRHAFESEWVRLESETFRFRDAANRERRFIPLRLDDAEINVSLKQFAYVDWRNKGDERYAKLLVSCRSVAGLTPEHSGITPRLRVVASLWDQAAAFHAVALSADGHLTQSQCAAAMSVWAEAGITRTWTCVR